MRLNNLGYLLKEGFKGIFTHGFMSFAAVCVTIACLVIVGSFSILAYNLDEMVKDLNKTSMCTPGTASCIWNITGATTPLRRTIKR